MFIKRKKKKPSENPALAWAKSEVELALSKPESQANKKYLEMVYDSALKAYEVLLSQGHSGFSISLAMVALKQLVDRKPLTEITEKDFENLPSLDWGENYLKRNNLREIYQCPRYPALFKHVYQDGKIGYSDNNRVETIDRFGSTCHCGSITKRIDAEFPITLPYNPGKPYKVYTVEFTYDYEKGEVTIDPGVYNSMYISHIVTPEGKTITMKEWFFEKGVPEGPHSLDSLERKLVAALEESGLSTDLFKS